MQEQEQQHHQLETVNCSNQDPAQGLFLSKHAARNNNLVQALGLQDPKVLDIPHLICEKKVLDNLSSIIARLRKLSPHGRKKHHQASERVSEDSHKCMRRRSTASSSSREERDSRTLWRSSFLGTSALLVLFPICSIEFPICSQFHYLNLLHLKLSGTSACAWWCSQCVVPNGSQYVPNFHKLRSPVHASTKP